MIERYQYTAVAGVRVAYIDYGGPDNGPPMVLVHGMAGSTAHWAAVGDPLAHSRRVFALDLPGFGLSEPGKKAVDLWTHQHVLDAFIAKVIGEASIVVGSSMGALVALLQAARAPERVAALVLVDPAGPRTSLHYVTSGRGLEVLPLMLPCGVGEWLIRRALRRQTSERRVGQILDAISVDARRIPPEVVSSCIEVDREHLRRTGGPKAAVQTLRSMLRLFWLPTYRRTVDAIEAPTLVVHGREDPIVPPAASTWLALRRREWTLEILQKVGHAPQMECPELFVQTVDGWLGAHA